MSCTRYSPTNGSGSKRGPHTRHGGGGLRCCCLRQIDYIPVSLYNVELRGNIKCSGFVLILEIFVVLPAAFTRRLLIGNVGIRD